MQEVMHMLKRVFYSQNRKLFVLWLIYNIFILLYIYTNVLMYSTCYLELTAEVCTSVQKHDYTAAFKRVHKSYAVFRCLLEKR